MFRPTVRRLPQVYRTQIRQLSSGTPNPTKPFQRTKIAVAATLAVGTGYAAYTSFSNPLDRAARTISTKGSLQWQGYAVKPFTLDDVKNWMQKGQVASPKGWKHPDVKTWEAINLASNFPCEDTMVFGEHAVTGTTQPWLCWGVFDGHVGSAMSTTLKEVLAPYVARNLSQLYQSFGTEVPPPTAVDIAIQSAFRQLDDSILADGAKALTDAQSFTETISRLAPSFAGSCAIFAIYDPNTKFLRVACTGDSRAVLGRRSSSGIYSCTPLSVDQTGFNALELARLAAEHPGESNVVDLKTGRVLGIAVSRAFGDGVWKWPIEVLKECKKRYFWKDLRPGYKSPPYLTAEPVVTTTRIEGGEFVILASDGLWDHLSSGQAVKLVGMWLDAKKEGTIGKGMREGKEKIERANLWAKVEGKESQFVVEDESVTAHLVRNALGGSDHERLCGLAGAQPPYSRSVRDDITVQVIFFKDDL